MRKYGQSVQERHSGWVCNDDDISGEISVTIPELPAGPNPTLTVTAIINATSPTGRTLAVTASDIPDTIHNVVYSLTISKLCTISEAYYGEYTTL